MKNAFNKVIGLLCIFALIVSTLMVPASAVTYNTSEVIDSWQFFSDEHTDMQTGADTIYGNTEQTIIINNQKTYTYTKKNINNGIYEADHYKSDGSGRGFTVVTFKLAKRLTLGQTYKFDMGFYSESGTWVENLALACYGGALGGKWSSNQYNNDVWGALSTDKLLSSKPNGAVSINTGNRITFEFTATEALSTRDYLVFTYRTADTNKIAKYYMTDAKLKKISTVNDSTIKKYWGFFDDSHSGLEAQSTTVYGNSDNSIVINNQNYADAQRTTKKSISDGILTFDHIYESGTASTTRGYGFISYKFGDDRLVPGNIYDFNIGFYSNGKYAENIELYYATAAVNGKWSYNQYNTQRTDLTSSRIENKGSQYISKDSTNRLNFNFIATSDMANATCLVFAYSTANDTAQRTAKFYVKDATLKETVVDNTPVLDNNGNIVAGDWSFEGKTFNDPDINVVTSNADTSSTFVTRTISDGVYYLTSSDKSRDMYHAPLRVYFKLNKDLVAGKEYTLSVNTYGLEANNFYETNSAVYYNSKIDHCGDNGGVINRTLATAPLVPSTAIGTTYRTSNYNLPTDPNSTLDYTFTATEGMVAGGYIAFAAKLANDAKGTFCVKGATLIGDNKVNMVDYDMDVDINAGENATFIYTSTGEDASYGATNSSGSAASGVDSEIMSGKSVLKKYQYQLIMAVPTDDINYGDNCVVLEPDKQYSVKLKAACGHNGGSVYFYAGDPTNFDEDGGTNPNNGCTLYEIAHFDGVTANINTPGTYTYKFATTGMNIDFDTYNQLYVVIRPYDSTQKNITHCYSLSVSSFAEKGYRFNNAVKLEKTRYNKIVLAENSYATYAIKDNTSGEYTELEDNNAFFLDPDTSYTFKVKYADDGLFLSEDYGEEYTFKTMKFGDVNADNSVNIIDIVSLKKGLANISEDDILDLTDDDVRDSSDLTALINAILGITQ